MEGLPPDPRSVTPMLASNVLRFTVVLLIIACARRPATAPVTEFRGHYTPGFEVSRFIACNAAPADQPWWVILSARALQQRDSILRTVQPGPGSRVFVRWRAVLGAPSQTGHLGQSVRHIQVVELIELQTPSEGDCRQD